MSFKSRFDKQPPLPTATQRDLEEVSKKKVAELQAREIQPLTVVDLKDQDKIEKPTLEIERSSQKTQDFHSPENSSMSPPKFSMVENSSTVEKFSTHIVKKVSQTPEISSTHKGFLRLPHWILDELPSKLDANEQLLYIHLYRLSHGFGKDQCLVSLDTLANRVGTTDRTVQKTLSSLEEKGYIRKIGYTFGKKGSKGTTIWVENFSTQENPSMVEHSSDIKDLKDLKRKLIKEYRTLVIKIRELFGERSISELSEEVKTACIKYGIRFEPQIFNDNINEITRR